MISLALRVFCCLVVCLTCFDSARSAEPEKSKQRPNIILIMCDDMGWSDLGCYGGEVQTPNLDQMAREGLRFTQFYNNAVCWTTRASLVTGLYPRYPRPHLTTNMVTLGEVLKQAGYQTALSGKWHLGRTETTHPVYRGFEDYYGLLDGCCNFFDPYYRDPKYKWGSSGGGYRFFAKNTTRITEFPDDFYTTDAFTDHAIEQIKGYAKTDQPFFLHLCYTAPHYPLHAKPKDIAKYKGRYAAGWEALREERYQRQLKMGLVDPQWKLPERDPESADWENDKYPRDWQQRRMEVYAAMIDCMDQNIGRLMQTLKETGVDENTIVMFLSDNGPDASEPGGANPQQEPGPKEYYTTCGPSWAFPQNTPFRRFKTWMHEGGISTPLIVRWPGHVAPASLTRQPAHIIDVMPTCIELAETKYPETYAGHKIIPVEGKSMLPIFQGETRQPHESLFWELRNNQAVRQGKWKLVADRTINRWELYDLEQDRTETNNLASHNPERVAQMKAAWQEWAELTGVANQKHQRGKQIP
ncbi:MAG: arylsulfatase [Gimesia chilikensis]|uniref:arylsulfatase n=1 Tax=Gimesia chilikensis TaxID=2605989 RepID=UPI00378C440F